MSHFSTSALDEAANRWFGKAANQLLDSELRVLRQAMGRRTISRFPLEDRDKLSLGEKLADQVARFGGSWTFITAFILFLALWAGLNLVMAGQAFDPYPFIFLNLLLSMLAALQAPVIMMSQNRQAAKDRDAAAHDYEVNLKAEIEIIALHEKFDQMRTQQLEALVKYQEEQITLLNRLITEKRAGAT